MRWVKEGQPFFNWPQHIRDVNGTLHFDGVLFDDRGHYTCVATNAQGIINATIHIDVIGNTKKMSLKVTKRINYGFI